MSFVLIFLTAFILVFFFHIGFFFNTAISLILTAFVCFYIFYKFKKKVFGYLSVYVIFLCFLPFVHIIPLIFNPGLISEPFILGIGPGKTVLYDRRILELTAMIFLSCALGISFSISIFNIKNGSKYFNVYLKSDAQTINIKSLPLFLWFLFYFISIILFYGVTPPGGSIFQVTYGVRLAGFLDFTDAAFLIAFIFLTITIVDSFLDQNNKRKKIKLFFGLFFILFFLISFGSGTREAAPLLLGLIILYNLINFKKDIPVIKIFFIILILFIIFQMIGYIRSELVGASFYETLMIIKHYLKFNFLILGTWSSSLATILSISHDYVDNLLKFKLGKDYFDLFISIPPGFIADYIGYERPFNINSGPAYEMRYGLGGTHITVLPFRNFGILGVFLISAIWFYFILFLERFSFDKISVLRSSTFVTIVTIMPLFLWYGEKNLINGIIIFYILSVVYRICLPPKKKL